MLSPERVAALQTGWVRLLDGYGVAPAAAYPVFDALVAAYAAPARHYHNLEHVADVLRVAARLAPADAGAVQLAAWFHDAVYDPRAADNEDRSAELALAQLAPLGVPQPTLDRVAHLVRATAHLSDDRAPADRDTAALLDADLAILGAAPARYERYAAAIRREYAWVPEDEYRAGRARVLGRFLARPRLYWSDVMHAEGEAPARANMTAELAALG